MKKAMAVLMAVVVLFSFSACSQTELSFYNTMKSLANLDNLSFEGKLALNLNKLDLLSEDATQEEKDQVQAVKDALANSSLVYSGALDSKDNTLKLHLAEQASDGTSKDVLDLQAEGQYLYIDKDFIGQFTDTAAAAIKTIDGKEYVQIDLQEFVDTLFAGMEYAIRSVSAAPDYPTDKSDAYAAGYMNGFFGAQLDIQGQDTAYDKNYNYTGEYEGLSGQDATDYTTGYDAGYTDCFAASAGERAQDEQDIADLQQYKAPMMEKANAAYFINLFKNILLKGSDEAVADVLDDFEADLVQKQGDSKYAIHLGNNDFATVFGALTGYLDANQDKVASAAAKFVGSLSDEELILLGVYPKYRDQILDGFNQAEATGETSALAALENGSGQTEGDPSVGDVLPGEIIDPLLDGGLSSCFDFGYDFTVEKTGSVSYELTDSVSIKTKDAAADELGLDLDASLTNTLSVNKASAGDIQTQADVLQSTAGGATLNLKTADAAITECGILYSASTDLAGAVKAAGVKQDDGSYNVSLSGLNANTTYYYRAYTVDANGNLVYSGEVKNFTTAADTSAAGPAPVGNPDTGDASPVLWYGIVLGSAVCLLTLLKTKSGIKERS